MLEGRFCDLYGRTREGARGQGSILRGRSRITDKCPRQKFEVSRASRVAMTSPERPVLTYPLAAIKAGLPSNSELLELLADSFVAMTAGQIILGNASHLQFPSRSADACIKSAYRIGGVTWVVKCAGGWYKNGE